MPYPGAKTVHRALSLLKAFTDEHPTWTMTELATQAGISRPTVHRLLATLEGEGFITKVPRSTRYRLGPEAIVLGARALRAINLRDVAHRELESIAGATGEDISLDILVGLDVLVIDEIRGQNILGLASSIGTRWPAHATATGKVLLAFSSTPQAVTTRKLERFTDKTLTNWNDLSQALEDIRNQGYATNVEELEMGFVALAAPIRDREGNAAAAIGLGGSAHRIDEQRIPGLIALLCQGGERVSRLLGYSQNG